VKPGAFLPARDGATSVYRTRGLTEEEIWILGEAKVTGPTRKTLYGRGDLPVSAVHATGLRVDPDDSPPRHAAIVGWPEEKDARLSLAQQLAAKASLKLRGAEAA
jgi:hypothetical protein